MSGQSDRRYCILYDLDGERAKPCGLILEHHDHVEVITPAEKCFPERIDGPYTESLAFIAEPIKVYPGHRSYFDLVAHDLSRSFALGEEFRR